MPSHGSDVLAEADSLLKGNFRSARQAQQEQKAAKLAGHRFRPLLLADLIMFPPKEWLVDNLFGPRDLLMIYGPPGGGKTFVVIDLIFAACLGRPFAGCFNVTRPLTVAYCAGEGSGGLSQRFQAAAQHYRVEQLANFFFFQAVPQLAGSQEAATDGSMQHFVEEWRERHELGEGPDQLDLLIIDTLHSATVGMDENSAKDAGYVLEAMKFAARELQCAVLVVHHTNRAKSGERGSSAFRGAMDAMIEVTTKGKTCKIACQKLKDGVAWEPRPFTLLAMGRSARVEWLPPEPGKGATASGQQAQDQERLVAALHEHPTRRFTAKQLAEEIGKSDNHTRKLLAGLVEEGQCQRALSLPDRRASNRNPWVYFV